MPTSRECLTPGEISNRAAQWTRSARTTHCAWSRSQDVLRALLRGRTYLSGTRACASSPSPVCPRKHPDLAHPHTPNVALSSRASSTPPHTPFRTGKYRRSLPLVSRELRQHTDPGATSPRPCLQDRQGCIRAQCRSHHARRVPNRPPPVIPSVRTLLRIAQSCIRSRAQPARPPARIVGRRRRDPAHMCTPVVLVLRSHSAGVAVQNACALSGAMGNGRSRPWAGVAHD